MILHIQCINCR